MVHVVEAKTPKTAASVEARRRVQVVVIGLVGIPAPILRPVELRHVVVGGIAARASARRLQSSSRQRRNVAQRVKGKTRAGCDDGGIRLFAYADHTNAVEHAARQAGLV